MIKTPAMKIIAMEQTAANRRAVHQDVRIRDMKASRTRDLRDENDKCILNYFSPAVNDRE
jgi:hypothetical protein